jgi:hypothetical protein
VVQPIRCGFSCSSKLVRLSDRVRHDLKFIPGRR